MHSSAPGGQRIPHLRDARSAAAAAAAVLISRWPCVDLSVLDAWNYHGNSIRRNAPTAGNSVYTLNRKYNHADFFL